MDKTVVLASDILLGVGGEKNILRLENCMMAASEQVPMILSAPSQKPKRSTKRR